MFPHNCQIRNRFAIYVTDCDIHTTMCIGGQEVLTIQPAHYMISTLNTDAAPLQNRTIPLDTSEQYVTSVPQEFRHMRSNILRTSTENLVMPSNTQQDHLIPVHQSPRSLHTPSSCGTGVSHGSPYSSLSHGSQYSSLTRTIDNSAIDNPMDLSGNGDNVETDRFSIIQKSPSDTSNTVPVIATEEEDSTVPSADQGLTQHIQLSAAGTSNQGSPKYSPLSSAPHTEAEVHNHSSFSLAVQGVSPARHQPCLLIPQVQSETLPVCQVVPPQQAPQKSPKQTPQQPPEQAPPQSPQQAPPQSPKQTPQQSPKQTLWQSSEQTFQQSPQRSPSPPPMEQPSHNFDSPPLSPLAQLSKLSPHLSLYGSPPLLSPQHQLAAACVTHILSNETPKIDVNNCKSILDELTSVMGREIPRLPHYFSSHQLPPTLYSEPSTQQTASEPTASTSQVNVDHSTSHGDSFSMLHTPEYKAYDKDDPEWLPEKSLSDITDSGSDLDTYSPKRHRRVQNSPMSPTAERTQP